MKKLITMSILILVYTTCFVLLSGATSENGKMNLNLQYETAGQNNLFVTASGTGDCLSLDKASTFQTADSKSTDAVQDVLWLSPEDHDTDNGSDGTGTDITAKNVRIIGSGDTHQFATRLFNGHATATIVLTLSGHRISLENLRFTQEDKTDVDVTYINITGNRSLIDTCEVRSATGATADIGILYSNGSQYHYVNHVHLRTLQTAGIRTAEADHIEFSELYFEANAIGMDFTHANDGPFFIDDSLFKNCTSGIEIAAGVISVGYNRPMFLDCTANVGSAGDYDVLHMADLKTAHALVGVYPLGVGVTVTADAAAWTRGNLTEIIPADTITTPFFLEGLNVQSASATESYQVKVFYGESSASNVSLGVFEFVSDRKTGVSMNGLNVQAIPANSYVGIKLETSSTNADTCVLTFGYKASN